MPSSREIQLEKENAVCREAMVRLLANAYKTDGNPDEDDGFRIAGREIRAIEELLDRYDCGGRRSDW